jgi:Flp pilus assembly protein TadD
VSNKIIYKTITIAVACAFTVSCKHINPADRANKLKQEQGHKAVDLHKQALREAPQHFLMHLNLIKSYLKNNQPGLALSLLSPLIELYPHDPELYNLKGVAFDLQHNPIEAQKAYVEGLKKAPLNKKLQKNYDLSKELMLKNASKINS